MKKKLVVFSGILILALVITTGTFAFGYTNQSTIDLNATMADGAWATYEPSVSQPDWEQVLPSGNQGSEILTPNGGGDQTEMDTQYPAKGEDWDKVDEYPTPMTAPLILPLLPIIMKLTSITCPTPNPRQSPRSRIFKALRFISGSIIPPTPLTSLLQRSPLSRRKVP